LSNKELILAQQNFLKGNLFESKKICLKLLNTKKDFEVLNLLGLIELYSKNYLKSFNYLNQSIKLNNNNEKALNNIGNLLITINKPNKAIFFLKKAIQINKKFFSAYLNISIAYQKKGQFKKSTNYLFEILSIDKKNIDALNNLGKIFFDKLDYIRSLEYYTKAIKIDNNQFIHNNLGLLYERLNKFQKAIKHYKEAIKIDPTFYDCKFNLSILYLKIGKCQEGLKLYESRFLKLENPTKISKILGYNNINKEIINKEKLIYIVDEQGYGDLFNFCRFFLILKENKFNVVFVVRDELFYFFETQKIFNKFIKKSDFLNLDANKITYIPLQSVPLIFNLNHKDILYKRSYFQPDKKKREYWKSKISNNYFNIGIAWSAKKKIYGFDRNIPIKYFFKLTKLNKVRLISLQIESENIKLSSNDVEKNKVLFFEELDKDYKFGDTAALISNLDLIITTDTSIAHLAGAMGKKTWVLLSFYHDWRWLLKKTNSYWYQYTKLFRSKKVEDWNNIFEKVINELKKLLN